MLHIFISEGMYAWRQERTGCWETARLFSFRSCRGWTEWT